MTTPWFVLVYKNNLKKKWKTIRRKPTNHRECEYYAFCIGVFWLCAGNDRLDVLPLGGGHPWLCGLLCRRSWIHTVDDNCGALLAGTPSQCHGHCRVGQLDGQLRGRHRIPQHEGWPAAGSIHSKLIWLIFLLFSDRAGELHILAIQRILSHILDIHVQEGTGDQKQNLRGDLGSLPSQQRQVCWVASLARPEPRGLLARTSLQFDNFIRSPSIALSHMNN